MKQVLFPFLPFYLIRDLRKKPDRGQDPSDGRTRNPRPLEEALKTSGGGAEDLFGRGTEDLSERGNEALSGRVTDDLSGRGTEDHSGRGTEDLSGRGTQAFGKRHPSPRGEAPKAPEKRHSKPSGRGTQAFGKRLLKPSGRGTQSPQERHPRPRSGAPTGKTVSWLCRMVGVGTFQSFPRRGHSEADGRRPGHSDQ